MEKEKKKRNKKDKKKDQKKMGNEREQNYDEASDSAPFFEANVVFPCLEVGANLDMAFNVANYP